MDPGTIAAIAILLPGAAAMAALHRVLRWPPAAYPLICALTIGVLSIATGSPIFGVFVIAAAILPFVAVGWLRDGSVPQSALWRGRPETHVVYILRNADGIPLYIGRSDDFGRRVPEHWRKGEPWRKRIDPFNSMVVRWCRGEKAAIRIERRRIRAATVLTSWRLVPELHNAAEKHSGRVWFPRAWAVVYACESHLFRRARLLSALRVARPFAEVEPEPEPVEHHVAHDSAESFDDRWPDRVILDAQVRSGEGASASSRPRADAPQPAPAGRAADAVDADADADTSPPSGEPRRDADASAAPGADPRSDRDALLSVVNGDSSPSQDQTAPMGTPAVVVKLQQGGSRRRSGGPKRAPRAKGNPKHDDATRERWRRNKAQARAEGRAR